VLLTVHLLEVGNLVEIADVDDGEVLDSVGDTVEDLVLSHAVGVPVATEADDDEALFLGHDSLVDVPLQRISTMFPVKSKSKSREDETLFGSPNTAKSRKGLLTPVTRWGRTTEPILCVVVVRDVVEVGD
jgi:hypothetical protein